MPRRKTRKNHKGGMDGTSTSTSLADKIKDGFRDLGDAASNAANAATTVAKNAQQGLNDINKARNRAKTNGNSNFTMPSISSDTSAAASTTSVDKPVVGGLDTPTGVIGGKRKSRRKKRRTKRKKKRKTKRRRKSRRKRRR